MNETTRFCRTFPDATENHENCSVATLIERHRGLLTPDQLATLLAVSRKSVYSWVKQGTLKAVFLGTSIRFCPHATAAWLRAKSG